MKNTLAKMLLTFMLVTLLVSSCTKDEIGIGLKSCNLSNEVKNVSGLKGTIWFNSAVNGYAIYVSIPGTYDSQDVGIVCNLPEKFQVDGTKIIFSGKYFNYEKPVSQKFAGQTYYTTELSKIEGE